MFVFQLRLGGIFQKPLAAAVAGTLLCISTLGVFVAAVVLANNDRRADARAQCMDSYAGERHDAISDSSVVGDTTAPHAEEDEGGPQPQEDSAQAEAYSSPHDERGDRPVEASKTPPSKSGEDESASSWLACVIGGNLCLEDWRNMPQNEEEAL